MYIVAIYTPREKKTFIIFPSYEVEHTMVLYFSENKSPSTQASLLTFRSMSSYAQHWTEYTPLLRCLQHCMAALPLHRRRCDASLSKWSWFRCFVETFPACLPALMALGWLDPASSLSLLHQWNSYQDPLIFIWLCDRAYVGMTVYMCAGGLLIWQKPNPIKAKLCFYVNK